QFEILYETNEIDAQDLRLVTDVIKKFPCFSVDKSMVQQLKIEITDFIKRKNIPKYDSHIRRKFYNEIKWLHGKEITPANFTKDIMLENIILSAEKLYSGSNS